jgi:predicted RNA-binding protein associated with RNAse of E/G family
MIIADMLQKNTSLALRIVVAALAILLVPLGLLNAQDVEAVKQRLTKAVKHDEISLEQAAIMMQALLDSSRHQEQEEFERERAHQQTLDRDLDRKSNQREQEFRASVEGLEMALEAGKISRQQFQEKLQELDRKYHSAAGQEHDAEAREHMYREAEAKIMQAYEAGNITREEAGKKLASVKKSLSQQDGNPTKPANSEREEKLHRVEMELKQAVESGRITEAEARKKLESIKRGSAGEKKKVVDEREVEFRKAQAELTELLQAGKITKEQALERLAALKKELSGEAKKRNSGVDERKLKFQKAESEIGEMIKSGKITKEQGNERLLELKKHLWPETKSPETKSPEANSPEAKDVFRGKNDADHGRAKIDFEAYKQKIEAALESGKITREQANEAFEGLKKRMQANRMQANEEGRKPVDKE